MPCTPVSIRMKPSRQRKSQASPSVSAAISGKRSICSSDPSFFALLCSACDLRATNHTRSSISAESFIKFEPVTHITGSLESGDDLLSRAVASQVPSARRGLTSVFGMGTGGSLLPLSPEIVFNSLVCSGLRPENYTGKADLEFTRSRMFACGIHPYARSPLLCFLSSFQIKPSTD